MLRNLAVSTLGLCLCVAAAEAAVRSEWVYATLPLPRIHYSYDVTNSSHALDRLQATDGPVDVLFLGSSAVRAAIMPLKFDAAVAKDGGPRLLSFNGGMSSMFPSGARIYMEHYWRPRVTPKYVLHGVRPPELYNAQPVPQYLRRSGVIEPLWLSGSLRDEVEAFVLDHVHLLHYRGTVMKVLQQARDGKRIGGTERTTYGTDARGFRRAKASLARNIKNKSKRLWVWKRPTTPKNFEAGFRELERIKSLCDAMGARYVLVHLPEHPKRYNAKKNGKPAWSLYYAELQRWAAEHDVPVLDVTHGDYKAFASTKYYSDYHHLAAAGADHMTGLLATEFKKLIAPK
jgi:hypothetical protein